MSGTGELPLGRGRQELKAAEALLEAGFPGQAVSHAYLAGFHAASAALAVLGEVPATSSGVISAFGRHVVGEDGVDHETGRVLRRLYEDRNDIENGLWTLLWRRHGSRWRTRAASWRRPRAGSGGARAGESTPGELRA